MAKREETVRIENKLEKHCQLYRLYGCKEVTIGFHNAGMGNEVVDFILMDSKGVIKCYEIKVTLEDLKSKAKKSWYGHYNYLVVSKELYEKVEDWSEYLPNGVGLMCEMSSIKKAKRQNIDASTELMLKESMVRSMFWKMTRLRLRAGILGSSSAEMKASFEIM
ncbi:hypothetical protein M2146_002527 [Lachnospiraceae bacterium PF1-22]